MSARHTKRTIARNVGIAVTAVAIGTILFGGIRPAAPEMQSDLGRALQERDRALALRDEVRRAADFSCGYTYGTRDSVVTLNALHADNPKIQPPQPCAEVEALATKHGFRRIVR